MSLIREAIELSFYSTYLNEAYDILVRTDSDVTELVMNPISKKILLFYKNNFKKYSSFKWDEILPITIESNSEMTRNVKFNFGGDMKKLESLIKDIIRNGKFKEISYKKNKSSINIILKESKEVILRCYLGAGTRNKKAGGGKAGVSFEVDLTEDLNSLARRTNVYKYPSFVEKIVSKVKDVYNIDLNKEEFYAEQLAGKNQKRNIKFNGKKFTATPEGDKVASVLTDVDIVTKNKRIHLSLKFTSQFYLTNFSIREYLGDMSRVEKSRDEILYYLGFNPTKWSNGYGAPSGMDKELPDSKKMKNLEQLFKVSLGSGYIYVVGGGKKDVVEFISKEHSVEVLSIIDVGYSNEKRKYSFVKCQLKIGNSRYIATLQNRGTTSNGRPIYIRVLLTQ